MCPSCNSDATAVIESRKCSNGSQRRRHVCHACGHRWTTHKGLPPGHRGGYPPKITPDQVRFILLSTDPLRVIAEHIGRSVEAVRQVRVNITHRNIHPEIQRPGQPRPKPLPTDGPTCYQCQHWVDRCTFGYPDPLEEGPGFASDCSMFTP